MLGAYMAHPSIGSCTYHLHLVADRWNQVHIFHTFGGKCRWFVWRGAFSGRRVCCSVYVGKHLTGTSLGHHAHLSHLTRNFDGGYASSRVHYLIYVAQ